VARGLLVAGTTSDAGKSLVTAGLCRWLARQGVSVAPFKAQNMSNNSMVCADGSEIGRAQWLQALACGVVPEAAMNPVLLKPGSDLRSHVVLMGRSWGDLEAGEWATGRKVLAQKAFDAFRDLSSRFDVVIAEGAGSPAEINLREGDFVNMGLARAVDLPVVVVGDIDRGGVLAAMYGTLALLDEADQAHIRGWIVNKFRGDLSLLQPGLRMLEERTSRPVLGTLPFLYDVWLDGEDALAISGWSGASSAGTTAESAVGTTSAVGSTLSVAVIRFPRVSNATDVDALAAEPGVDVRVTADPDVVARADLVVLPGSRATLSDLEWMRSRGLDKAVLSRAVAGRPVLGICGGYQMLAESIADADGVESHSAQTVAGLGLLPTQVRFDAHKHLGRPRGQWRGNAVTAYEIHHGVAVRTLDGPDAEPFLDGWRCGPVWGTTWHGAMENDDFRRAFLTEVASQAGVRWRADPKAQGFAARRESMLDRLADAIDEHLDTAALTALVGIDLRDGHTAYDLPMTADESARTFPETTLTAGDLTLRPLTEADADDITVACQDAETLRWLPLPRPYTRASAEWFIRTFGPSQRESGAGVVFAIECASRLVGAIDLKQVDWASKVAEVGYWVAPWARGRGVASEATRSLARWAIHEHGFERVELFAATGNLASQRAAEKAGLTREGIARNAGYLHDSRVDLVVYSMVRDDLPTSLGESSELA
jgi:adenosylcobyric acid synthase